MKRLVYRDRCLVCSRTSFRYLSWRCERMGDKRHWHMSSGWCRLSAMLSRTLTTTTVKAKNKLLWWVCQLVMRWLMSTHQVDVSLIKMSLDCVHQDHSPSRHICANGLDTSESHLVSVPFLVSRSPSSSSCTSRSWCNHFFRCPS